MWFLTDEINSLKRQKPPQNITSVQETSPQDKESKTSSDAVQSDFQKDFKFSDCLDCQSRVEDIVDAAVKDLSKESNADVTVSTKEKQTSYIPLISAEIGSTSTDWYTVDAAQVYIDLLNDYSSVAQVSWEVSLKVKHGNGQAFARLWDDTNKIAVVGSELTTQDNADYKYVSSGSLNLWNGRNLYKLQLKSLNGFEVTAANARIKISY